MGQQEVARVRDHMKTAPFYPAADSTVSENREFPYVVFVPAGKEKCDRAIILLHGLNERNWNKYLVWAEDLVMTCGVPVLLFPMAFHMNRTPTSWFTPRWLKPWLNRRKQEIMGLCNASFFNVALSSRLSVDPLRFYSSGTPHVMTRSSAHTRYLFQFLSFSPCSKIMARSHFSFPAGTNTT
jgi:hypothetical protein